MKEDMKSSLDNHDYYGRIFDYQKSRPVPLAALDYYILAEDYFLNLTYMPMFFPDIEDRSPKELKPYRQAPMPLNTACFNLTKYFGHRLTNDDLARLDSAFGNFMTVFYAATKGSCALSITQPTSGESEVLLLCLPTALDEKGKTQSTREQDQEIKSAFFALLWDMGFMTEQQLYDNGIMLGRVGGNITSRKSAADKPPKP